MDEAKDAAIEAPKRRRGRGNPSFLRPTVKNQTVKSAYYQQRTAVALGEMFGEHVREIVHCVANATKAGTMPAILGKQILDAVLPAARPVQLDMPQISNGAALIEAENKITAALNSGAVSLQEARTLQSWARNSWRSRKMGAAHND